MNTGEASDESVAAPAAPRDGDAYHPPFVISVAFAGARNLLQGLEHLPGSDQARLLGGLEASLREALKTLPHSERLNLSN